MYLPFLKVGIVKVFRHFIVFEKSSTLFSTTLNQMYLFSLYIEILFEILSNTVCFATYKISHFVQKPSIVLSYMSSITLKIGVLVYEQLKTPLANLKPRSNFCLSQT